MEIGELVGRGRRCDVYAWGEDQVIKVFAPDVQRGYLEREQGLTRVLHDAGLPVPGVGDIIDLGGRLGLVYQRLKGPTLDALIRSDPARATALVRALAEVHASIHSTVIPGLPSQRARLVRSIELAPFLSDGAKQATLRALSVLPDGDSVCHGDLNAHNVIFTPEGIRIIDWDNASRGNPLCDVARSLLMVDASPMHSSRQERQFISEILPPIRQAYLTRYLEMRPGTVDEVDAWRLPVAAARLREGITEENEWLIATVTEMASRLR